MSKKPLIIKSTFYNIKPEKMEEVRRIIKKQMEEATPVVMLPSGFELAEVNEEMLESIKAEIDDLDRHYDNDYFSGNKEPMFKFLRF